MNKEKNTAAKQFFQTDICPLNLSNESSRLKALPYYTWLFQLIEIYQSRDSFKNSTKKWSFIKGDNDVKAICNDANGTTLVYLSNNIFDQHTYFKDLTLFVIEGECMIEEEYFNNPKISTHTHQFSLTA